MQVGPAELAPEAPCVPWVIPVLSGDSSPANPLWCCDPIDGGDAVAVARADLLARAVSSLLFRMSGLRFNGACTAAEYLCLRRDPCGCWRLAWGFGNGGRFAYPSGDGETWINGTCSTSCDCGTGRRIQLPYGPVLGVTRVVVDGTEIDAEAIKVVGDYLYICDGPSLRTCFDACSGDGLLVEWTWGQKPPPEGEMAATVLLCELIKGCSGKPCALPKRTVQVARQGMSLSMFDPMEFLKDGRTGIYEVDLFLSVWGESAGTTVVFPEQVAPLDFGSSPRTRW